MTRSSWAAIWPVLGLSLFFIACQPPPAAPPTDAPQTAVLPTVTDPTREATPTLQATPAETFTPAPTWTASPTPTLTPTPTNTPMPFILIEESASGTLFTLPAERFQIEIPSGWEVADLSGNPAPNDSPVIAELRASGILDELYDSNVRMYAFKSDDEAAAANLNLVHERLSDPITLEIMLNRLVSQAEFGLADENGAFASTNQINGQSRGIVTFQNVVFSPVGDQFELQTVQTVIVDEEQNDVWILSVNYATDLGGSDLADIEAILDSFEVFFEG